MAFTEKILTDILPNCF